MNGIFILYLGLRKLKISTKILWEFLFLRNKKIIGHGILDFFFFLFFWFFLNFSPNFSRVLKEGNRIKKRKSDGWINVLVEALIIFVLENQDNSFLGFCFFIGRKPDYFNLYFSKLTKQFRTKLIYATSSDSFFNCSIIQLSIVL